MVACSPGGAPSPLSFMIAGMRRSFSNRSYASRDSQMSVIVHSPSISPAEWKLAVRDRVQAVVFAYEAGLVTPGD